MRTINDPSVGLFLLQVPRHTVFETNQTTSKYVQRASDGDVHFAFTQRPDSLKVIQVLRAASIGDWDRAIFPHLLHQPLIYALL